MDVKDKLIEKQKELIGHFEINYRSIKASPGSNFQPIYAKNITRKLKSEIAALDKEVEEQECDHPFAFVHTRCNGEINRCLKCGKNL